MNLSSLSRMLFLRSQRAAHQKLFSYRSFSSAQVNRTDSTPYQDRNESLYRRISPIGDSSASITPVLEQWVQEGRDVDEHALRRIIKELTRYGRYKHALELSHWMSDRRYFPLSHVDIGGRLKLIYRVSGLEQAETYFNNIPIQLRGWVVLMDMLYCYSEAKQITKAELLMPLLHQNNKFHKPSPYNIIMDLYSKMASWDKLKACLLKMEQDGIKWDKYTAGIQLGAYIQASDVDGIEHLMNKIESHPDIVPDFATYSLAARGFIKLGRLEKGLELTKRIEGLVRKTKKRTEAFHELLGLYSSAGERDHVYRIWNWYKTSETVYNRGYIRMMDSLMKMDDVEGAEKIFEEWESSKELTYDFRIPNILIRSYCKKGLFDKAESLIAKGIESQGNPTFTTWYSLADAYLQVDRVSKAADALKEAIALHNSSHLSKDTLSTCLEYLEGRGDMSKADSFMETLKNEEIFSTVVRERMLDYIGRKFSNEA
ncbi:pentatricopeptide repeat-containing protein At2g20710, mitochondrial-like [Impatiens glandulifera]|uniref:pentatricopeptide repeat-containing protein At2g20710, mitochondrial-like n=1 Tax=Impatiens glandulifera TaxID=253017 RepID=UPI001FB162E5|nr:pentatricopeptide repeat-containing protein At2g20710, mitochondrial-like [Impatiens glandulifera]